MYCIENPTALIRSLSGLVNYQGLVLGVSDEFKGLFMRNGEHDSFFDFSAVSANLDYRERKKIKPDHESISLIKGNNQDYVMSFPSLSKSHRNEVSIFQVNRDGAEFRIASERTFKVTSLLEKLSQSGRELNVEGHFFNGQNLFLLNRGNESTGNELIRLKGAQDWQTVALSRESDHGFEYEINRYDVDLGSYEGHSVHWTDAMKETDSTLIFLATIEKTNNAYDDGEVLASFMGRYDYQTRRVVKMRKILDSKKAEGICLWNSRYLVCIDSDSAEMGNEFYSFSRNYID